MTPDQYTRSEQQLDVGDGHSLYVHDWGNPQATHVVIHLHGGPGSGSSDRYKQTYDPARQRVIFFDQRGAGRSTPYGELAHNTTDDLVSDITKIADHFKLDDFILVGNSWGSCLALAYGLAHPQRVRAMVISGIFTGSTSEIAWLDQGLFRIFMPDVWQDYLAATPQAHHSDPSGYYFNNILGSDAEAAKRSAYAYSNLEAGIIKLDDRFSPETYDEFDPNSTRIEVSYMANQCFMPENHILQQAHKLSMPIYIVQGRYDMVCPPQTAYGLAQKLPRGHLIWTTSGHVWERESWNITRTIIGTLTDAQQSPNLQ